MIQKQKVDELNVGKLKTVPVDLKKLSDALSKEIVQKAVDNTINTKVKNLEIKIPYASIYSDSQKSIQQR